MLKLDVYSFGIVLWETWTRTLPYSGRPSAEVIEGLRHGMRPPVPDDCPGEYSALMQRCWAKDATIRPEFDEISEDLTAMIEVEDARIGRIKAKREKSMEIPAFAGISTTGGADGDAAGLGYPVREREVSEASEVPRTASMEGATELEDVERRGR
jgi:hypothetical protein